MTMKTWEELTELEQLHEQYSDFYKEAHGCRPRHSVEGWTVEDFKKVFEQLDRICEQNRIDEEARANKAIEAVELKISQLCQMGAGDRATAIRWLADAEFGDDPQRDPDYLCYVLGVPCGYFEDVL